MCSNPESNGQRFFVYRAHQCKVRQSIIMVSKRTSLTNKSSAIKRGEGTWARDLKNYISKVRFQQYKRLMWRQQPSVPVECEVVGDITSSMQVSNGEQSGGPLGDIC